jgi:hypothetical protein
VAVVDFDTVINAINTNDFDLALRHVGIVTPFLKKYLPSTGFVLNPQSIDTFVRFAKDVNKKGIERFFPTYGIMQSWCANQQQDFATFLQKV